MSLELFPDNCPVDGSILNRDAAFARSSPRDLEAGRLAGVRAILEHLPEVLAHQLDLHPMRRNLPIVDVSDTALRRDSFLREALRMCTFGMLGKPQALEGLGSSAYRELWDGLISAGVTPFISTWSDIAADDCIPYAAVCVSADDVRRYLKDSPPGAERPGAQSTN